MQTGLYLLFSAIYYSCRIDVYITALSGWVGVGMKKKFSDVSQTTKNASPWPDAYSVSIWIITPGSISQCLLLLMSDRRLHHWPITVDLEWDILIIIIISLPCIGFQTWTLCLKKIIMTSFLLTIRPNKTLSVCVLKFHSFVLVLNMYVGMYVCCSIPGEKKTKVIVDFMKGYCCWLFMKGKFHTQSHG